MSAFTELIGGVAMVLLSILLVIFRRPLSDFMQAQQRNMFGRLGARVTRSPAAVAYAFVGGLGIFIGLVFVIGAIPRLAR